jgi:ABC-type multidrug transport system ATPase subunit
MITITALSKTYSGQVQALRGIDLQIGAGMFGLLGPNGAGKTTLMRILATLIRPTSGTACVLGNDVTDNAARPAIRQILGYLPQELALYENLTAVEFLDYIAILKGIRSSAARQRQIAALLDTVGLVEVGRRKLKTYSGGMKRRVGIAQALLGDPRLLIIDEPTSGLDPAERVRLRNLLADLARERVVILSTHIIEDIGQTCSEMAVLNQGQVLFHGHPKSLIEQARGRVWTIVTDGDQPDGYLVVSTLQVGDGIQYRVLGKCPTGPKSTATEPTLEDGYLWLMAQATHGAGGDARIIEESN